MFVIANGTRCSSYGLFYFLSPLKRIKRRRVSSVYPISEKGIVEYNHLKRVLDLYENRRLTDYLHLFIHLRALKGLFFTI